ncbi:hypothetical protein CBM2599_B30098 [Cupriavidus taiwanensis]|nr:hypothetical protein CBM2599_B30098 [Cupriavidus taiwanensis]SOY98845.1 hypothetical protein CBM2600_B30352 [Cupriavidus taiwanensis]
MGADGAILYSTRAGTSIPIGLPAGRRKTPDSITYPARMQQETRVARWSAPRSRHGTPLF